MWFLRIAALVCSAIGAFLAGLAVRNVARGRASKRWPQARGRILRSFVLVDHDRDGGEAFTPKVEYEYVVEGTTYRGGRLRYGQTGSWNRRQAERVIGPYAAGTPVNVFFDALHPADAVLLRGTSWGNVALALSGIAFLAVGYVLGVHSK